jgi:glycosyltransferase involved in cell wall biosynthesis
MSDNIAKKVLYFSKASDIGPTSRYRIFQYLPYLRAREVDVVVKPLFGPTYFWLLTWRAAWPKVIAKAIYVLLRFIKRAGDLLSMRRVDLIVIEGQLFPYCPATAERLLVKLNQKIVVELDDAIYLTRFHQRKMSAIMRMSSAAIVGNHVLAKYVEGFASSVSIIPTVVDTDRFHPPAQLGSNQDREGVTTIVWVGLASNFPYLELLVPVIRELQQTERIRFRVISSCPPVLPGVNLDFRLWSLEGEVTELQGGDIGVMPLPDTEWARGKCGLKLLQYMALGLPAVASPIGVNQEIISDGENGFLASTQEEWYATLLRLCRDVQLRVRIGQAARKTVKSKYSLSVWGPRLADRYRVIINESRPTESISPGGETPTR